VSKKIAIVHDWLINNGGAENCLEVMLEIFSEADLYTLFDKSDRFSARTSFLQKVPFVKRFYRYLMPLRPLAIESFDFSGYDLVISSSWSVAKGVIVPPDIPHIAYVYTPNRYAWGMKDEYFKSVKSIFNFRRLFQQFVLHYFRIWDFAASNRPDELIAISDFVAQRIQRFYRKDSQVIYPPVEVEDLFSARVDKQKKRDYSLMVTSFEPNKNVELAVKTFNKNGKKLKIIANRGRFEKRIKSLAKSNIEFLSNLNKDSLIKLYIEAEAVISPGLEDFGMVAVEAAAAGSKLVLYSKGGSREIFEKLNKRASVFFHELTVESLSQALGKLGEHEYNACTKSELEQFSKKHFAKAFKQVVDSKLKDVKENKN
jgi:glycosyltransferase involved in cell wall biosynthesis